MSSTVSSLGLSGLPLTDLLESLRTNESQILNAIQDRQTAAQTKLSAYSQLKSAVSSLQTAAKAVGKADAFGAITTVSGSNAFSATAGTSAIPGQYAIQVDQLATAQTLVYTGQADRTTSIGAGGTLKITIDGTERSIDLSNAGTSLNALAAAINAEPDIGVNATIVNDGTTGSQYRLLLISRETGEQNAVDNITVEGNDDLNAFLGYSKEDISPSNVTVQAATNAKLAINGIAITSQSNTINDVIDGVTLTLNQTTTSAASLTLTQDTSTAKTAIQGFVSAYNSLLNSIKTLTAYNTVAQTSAALTGDSLARSVQTGIRNALSGAIDSTNNTTLSKIGITTDPSTGRLEIDEAKLSAALTDNLDSVQSLFAGPNGVGTRVDASAESFVKSDGSFATTISGINKTIADIQKQYDDTSDRIDQRMETYRSQFTSLDALVSQMNSLSSYLTQQFSSLSSNKSGS